MANHNLELRAKYEARAPRPSNDGPLTVERLITSFMLYAQDTYTQRQGRSRSEVSNCREAVRCLGLMYGDFLAADITSYEMKRVREYMVDRGWCRSTINKRMSRIKRMFKWAAGESLIDGSVYHGVRSVEALKPGRSAAPEPTDVKPVPVEDYRAILPHVSENVNCILRLLFWTGMRPEEACQMSGCDIDRSRADVWVYKVPKHKTQWAGKDRIVFLGPNAIEIVQPRLQPGQIFKITASGVYQAVTKSCKRHGIPHWTPRQLRHNFVTRLWYEVGAEAAQLAASHSDIRTTQNYIDRRPDEALKFMSKVG
ncbi:MAG: tyrosine-type recombinase/integrase [Planctomycetota bacterium]